MPTSGRSEAHVFDAVRTPGGRGKPTSAPREVRPVSLLTERRRPRVTMSGGVATVLERVR